MPKPVTIPSGVTAAAAAASAKSKEPLTHKVTLENGKSFTLVDSERLSPWKFEEGVPVLVPARIAEKLKAKATDNVTVKVGTKVSSLNQPKFKLEKVGAAPAPEGEE